MSLISPKRDLVVFAASLALLGIPQMRAQDDQGQGRVMLISLDGMHSLDFQNCANGISGITGSDGIAGHSFCPNLAALANAGVTYTSASTSKPSDSFPGLIALVSGASPRTAGVYYDVSYARDVAAPSGPCVAGTEVAYDESLDVNTTFPTAGGIDPANLPRTFPGCLNRVYPRNYIRVNTIFGVAANHGIHTAWSDKHPAYDIVRGKTPIGGPVSPLLDLNSPEINSTVVALGAMNADLVSGLSLHCNPIRDPGADLSAWTTSFENQKCYDAYKVQILLNEIDGKNSSGTAAAPVPAIFGMNFQAVSVGQKLVEGVTTGGYVDPTLTNPAGQIGVPSPGLLGEIEFVDAAVGRLVTELKNKGLYQSTTIIIAAKHGQSPIDIRLLDRDNGSTERPTKIPALIPYIAGSSEDDVSILWLNHSSDTNAVVNILEQSITPGSGTPVDFGTIYAGSSMKLLFGDPLTDPRVPDLVVQPNVGVIYTGSAGKVSEHGGFAEDDTHTILLVSNPQLIPGTVTSPVENAQVAPTILHIIGLDPNELDGVRKENTQLLPGLHSSQDSQQ